MLSIRRAFAAILIGMIGCVCMWVAVPYNNFLLNNSYISDTYFPVAGVIFLLLLVLAVNPLLRLVRRELTLNRRQFALIFVMLLSAAVIPSQGLLRMLPWSLARTTQEINRSERIAEAFENTDVPHVLFPDKIGYDVETPASDQLLDELEEGAEIPWRNWLPLLLIWGVFLLSCWLLMVGVGLVLFPEWRKKERLPFPLLSVYRSLLPGRHSEGGMPSIFRDRMFWTGAVVVMLMYALNGLNHHTHGSFPGFPLGWDLREVFSDPPWRYLHGSIKNVRHIYFVLVGMAFFMPNRVGFSVWFTTIAYGIYAMVCRAYIPSYYGGAVHDHRNGAMIGVSLMVLYLSRKHWRHVGKVMVTRVTTDADRLLKVAGWMLAAGALGMLIWLMWAGVPFGWAAFFVLIGFMVSLLIARIVAETGMPFVRITGLNPGYFMAMFPAGWLSGSAIYMAGFISILFPMGSRVSAAVMASHAAGLDEEATPRFQLRLGYMMIAILLIGLVICGAVHLHMGYNHALTLDGSSAPLNAWGTARLRGVQNELLRWSTDSLPTPAHRLGNLGFGILLAGALQIACMTMPKWPLHPIGMLLVGHYYGQMAWASILLGWLLKVTIIKYGGASAFRRVKPLFVGIMMGEIFSAVIWTVVPVVLIWMGFDPAEVGHIPLLPT